MENTLLFGTIWHYDSELNELCQYNKKNSHHLRIKYIC